MKSRIPNFFTAAERSTPLITFITELDQQLKGLQLEIINGPAFLKTRSICEKAQDEMDFQNEKMERYGLLWGTTSGLIHVRSQNDLQRLDHKEIFTYYDQQAKLTIERQKCRCDGLCATVLKLATKMQEDKAMNNITIDICPLRNWSYSLIRFTLTKKLGDIERLFYDPWGQLCFPKTPNKIKIFPEEQLGVEISALIEQTPMIQPTETLFDLAKNAQVKNSSRDFSYFIACSSGAFDIPAVHYPDPTTQSKNCLIC